MRRRDLAILGVAVVAVVLVVGSSTALKIAVLAIIVAAILATRLGPRGR
jgi:hypothetical protein